MQEVTEVTVRKGSTGETVIRHVNSIIPLVNGTPLVSESSSSPLETTKKPKKSRIVRRAAKLSRQRTAALIRENAL